MFIYVLCASDEPLRVRYVGKAIDPKKRVSKHLRECGTSTPKLRWIETVAKRGAIIEWFVVEAVIDGDDANAAERRWISYYPAGQLTNSTMGGDGGATWVGRKHSADTRALMSAVQKGRRTGRSISDAQKAKQSAALKGKKLPKQRRDAIRKGRGQWMASLTAEQRADLTKRTTATRRARAADKAHLVSCLGCRQVMRARYATDRHRESVDCRAAVVARRKLDVEQAPRVSCVVCRRQVPTQMWHRHQGSKICAQGAAFMV